MGPGRRSRLPPELFQYSGLGCTFAAGVVLFTGAGLLLDRRVGVFPLFTLIGALVGTVLATLSVWRRFQPERKDDRSGGNPREP